MTLHKGVSRLAALTALLASLTACGLDGAPVTPEEEPTVKPGITVSGDVRMGVVKGI